MQTCGKKKKKKTFCRWPFHIWAWPKQVGRLSIRLLDWASSPYRNRACFVDTLQRLQSGPRVLRRSWNVESTLPRESWKIEARSLFKTEPSESSLPDLRTRTHRIRFSVIATLERSLISFPHSAGNPPVFLVEFRIFYIGATSFKRVFVWCCVLANLEVGNAITGKFDRLQSGSISKNSYVDFFNLLFIN